MQLVKMCGLDPCDSSEAISCAGIIGCNSCTIAISILTGSAIYGIAHNLELICNWVPLSTTSSIFKSISPLRSFKRRFSPSQKRMSLNQSILTLFTMGLSHYLMLELRDVNHSVHTKKNSDTDPRNGAASTMQGKLVCHDRLKGCLVFSLKGQIITVFFTALELLIV